MSERDQAIEAALKGVVEAFELCSGELETLGLDAASKYMISEAINQSKIALSIKPSSLRTFGKRREGRDRSSVSHPGLGELE